MNITFDHPHDRLREAMRSVARIENARLNGKGSGADFCARVRSALSHVPVTTMQIAEHATCSTATARRYADMLVEQGVAVRIVAKGANGLGGIAYFYALRIGAVA